MSSCLWNSASPFGGRFSGLHRFFLPTPAPMSAELLPKGKEAEEPGTSSPPGVATARGS